jgi:hypothetical protein
MTILSDDPVTCYVTPEGDVICDSASLVNISPATVSAIPEKISSWGPNKTQLLLNFIEVLDTSTLPDANVARRGSPIVQSAKQLLATEPPSILLFNFSKQPGDVMGNYFLNKAEIVRMHQVAEQFQKPTPS